ncbi:hypothetical protein ACXU4B_10835 [Dyella soli]
MNGSGDHRRARCDRVARGRRWIVAAILCCIALQAYGQAAAPTAERIVIESGWDGMSYLSPLQTRLTIVRDGASYRLTGGQSRGRDGKPQPERAIPPRTVAAADVARLVDAMRAPPQPRIDLRMLEPGIGHAQPLIDKILTQTQVLPAPASLAAKVHAWRDNLRQPAVLAEAVTKGFDLRHMDSSPHIDIQVTLGDGTTLSAQSDSHQYLMLPWTNANGDRTYSAAITRALDKLLPKAATNKELLEGKFDGYDLEWILVTGLAPELARLRSEEEAPDAVRLLDANFNVKRVAYVSDKQRYVEADLQLPQGPPNLLLTARLPLAGKSIANEADIARARQQLQLAQSSPVLVARMQSLPRTAFHIQDGADTIWLDQATARQFVQQMQDMKKLPELATQPALMQGAVMVAEGNPAAFWIVLADRRTVLWKQTSYEPTPTVGTSCPPVPLGDGASSEYQDGCLGKVYGTDGQEL